MTTLTGRAGGAGFLASGLGVIGADATGAATAVLPIGAVVFIFPPVPTAAFVLPADPPAALVFPPIPAAALVFPPIPAVAFVFPPNPAAALVLPPIPAAALVLPPIPAAFAFPLIPAAGLAGTGVFETAAEAWLLTTDFFGPADEATFLATGLAILLAAGNFFPDLLPPDEWAVLEAGFLAGAIFLAVAVFFAGLAAFFLVAI